MPVSRAEGVAVKLFLKTSIIAGIIALITACGGSTFELFPDTDSDTPANTAPVANAGPSQNVPVGATVTLNGSASSDANGNTLTYSWSFTSRPSGSGATLTGATAVNPTFTADVAGSYVVSLVVNDGKTNSAASSVTITSSDTPIANAGTAQSVLIGDTVTLDGSASSDPNGDALTYSWSFTYRPTGSSAALSSTTAIKPTFTADLAGPYVLSLIVNDGKTSSPAATVKIGAYDSPPTAIAGPDQTVTAGTTVQLDGSTSSGAILGYNWKFNSRPPDAGNVFLSSATVVNPTFTTTITGIYEIELIVKDRLISSLPVIVKVTITPSNAGSITVTW